jgi:hypothetical protein
MRCPNRHRQGVDVGFAHEGNRLVRVGDEFALVEASLETVTVFLVAAAGLERTEAADLSSTETPTAWAAFTTAAVARVL